MFIVRTGDIPEDKGGVPLVICPGCRPSGEACDGGDPGTLNDVTDGRCNCVGEPAAGEDVVLCPGGETQIGNSDNDPDLCYKWYPTHGLEDPDSPVTIARPERTMTYTLTGTDDQGNIQLISEVTVTVEPEREIAITPDPAVFCSAPLTLTGPAGFQSYEWRNAAGEIIGSAQTVDVGDPGGYSLTAYDNQLCPAKGIIEVQPAAQVDITPDPAAKCPTGRLELSTTELFSTYEWTDPNGVVIGTEQILTLGDGTPFGVYAVEVTDAAGCTGTATVEVVDAGDDAQMKDYFLSKGFYALEIDILGPALRDPQVELRDGACFTDQCTGPGGVCVQDEANLRFSLEGSPIDDLEAIAAINLQYFSDEFGYTDGKAYITKYARFYQ